MVFPIRPIARHRARKSWPRSSSSPTACLRALAQACQSASASSNAMGPQLHLTALVEHREELGLPFLGRGEGRRGGGHEAEAPGPQDRQDSGPRAGVSLGPRVGTASGDRPEGARRSNLGVIRIPIGASPFVIFRYGGSTKFRGAIGPPSRWRCGASHRPKVARQIRFSRVAACWRLGYRVVRIVRHNGINRVMVIEKSHCCQGWHRVPASKLLAALEGAPTRILRPIRNVRTWR